MRVVAAPDFGTLRRVLARSVVDLRRDSLARIGIVVPRETAREEVRRDLARRTGGTFAVDVIAWPRWIATWAGDAIARAGGRILPEAGFERLVARCLGEGAPRAAGGRSLATEGAGGARLLAATLADLLEGGFDAASLEDGPLRHDPLRSAIPDLLRRVTEALKQDRLWDRRRMERTAARAARAGERGPAGVVGTWILFGFHDLSPIQRDVVEAVSRLRPVTLLVPGVSPAGSEPGEGAVAPLVTWAREHGATLELLPRDVRPPLALEDDFFAAPALSDPGADFLELAAYATDSAEVRGIAGRILDDVAEGGRGFADFLITIPVGGGPSPRLFRRIFAKAGIPLRDAVGVPGSRTEPGRLARLLARAASGTRDDMSHDVLEFVAPSQRAAPDLAAVTKDFVRARDAAEASARFRALHEARLGGSPSPEVAEALEGVALALGRSLLRPREFAAAFAAALDATRARSPAGGGVLLVTMDSARGLARPVVFHAGLVRGAIRCPAGEDPWLPDAIRRALSDGMAHRGLHLPAREDRREERLLLARFAFECATERAILSFAERDRVGGEMRNPSGLLLDVASRRAGRPLDPRDPDFRLVAPSRPPGRARSRPADATDHDLAWLSEGVPAEEAIGAILRTDRARHLPRVLRGAEARWSEPRLGPWDGVLADPRALALVRARIERRRWSSTALETLGNCPFAYLLRLLDLDDAPEEPDDYDPRERGGLFHAIFEAVVRTMLERGRLPLDAETLPEALRLLDVAVAHERARLSAEPAARRVYRRGTLAALRADLATALAREARRAPTERTVPACLELAFGEADGGPTASFELPDGRRLPLRGRIDRVDRRADGALEILDLKTGVPRAAPGSLRKAVGGKVELRLQLPVYLEAAAQLLGRPAARARYWHATADHEFREIPYGAEDLERDRAELGRLLASLVAKARDGWFPCTPPPGGCCHGSRSRLCGPAVAERGWRKREDPELRAHLTLVRGDAPAEEDPRPEHHA